MRDKRKELERRNSSEGGPCKRWKYSAVPSFLDPFFSPREMSGNMDSSLEDRTGEYDPEAETAAASSAIADFSEPSSPFSEQESLLGPATASSSPSSARARSSSPGPFAAAGHFSSPGPSTAARQSPSPGPSAGAGQSPSPGPFAAAGYFSSPGSSTAAGSIRSRKKRKRSQEELLNLDREILRALQAGPPAPPPPPPMSDTELFLKSIIPMIDVLPPVRRGALKLKIHSLVFEAVSESM
ncbi:hypothetical protein FQA47_010831 [Oryzias melastigma]|uniref:BESS domain-containing protein n=1 Tax=Oryzias melastigma TaxID=30732 RepID=A0A834BYQ4_ORYME|nr:hypothetical protein FQA47_010831 [Oryzias melastigma]